jgi:hypothetical protein
MFLTSSLDGGELSASGPAHFTPEQEPRWALEPIWTLRRRAKLLTLLGIEASFLRCLVRVLVATSTKLPREGKSVFIFLTITQYAICVIITY